MLVPVPGKMVNNPLDYSNRIIFLMSFYSIYKGKYYIISAVHHLPRTALLSATIVDLHVSSFNLPLLPRY